MLKAYEFITQQRKSTQPKQQTTILFRMINFTQRFKQRVVLLAQPVIHGLAYKCSNSLTIFSCKKITDDNNK